jgi:hypothetical protein
MTETFAQFLLQSLDARRRYGLSPEGEYFGNSPHYRRRATKSFVASTGASQHEKDSREEHMVGELDVLNEWIPEQMQPGTVFVLENAGEIGEKEDPYWAVLSCPSCGMLGLITRKQINGLIPVICGSEQCSAQFFIRDAEVVVRKPF